MGCAFSSSGPGALPPFSGVRVIHTNGYVEDFPGPGVVTVAHVTSKQQQTTSAASATPARYVLCSSAHLLQPGRGPFRPDDALQPGTVYFLLPRTVFQSESSAVDLACLMNRLTALARKGCAAAAPGLSPVEALFAAASGADGDRQQEQQQQKRQQLMMVAAAQRANKEPSARLAPWRPRLDRIDESFGRASMRSASSRSACSEA